MKNLVSAALNEKIKNYIIDACVQTAQIWGYSDASGVLKGSLLLSEKPLSLDELALETGYSKSTVSTNLNLLLNLGLVKRVIKPGEKRHHYESVTAHDPIHTALMTNVRREVTTMLVALDQAERDLRASGNDPEILHIKERINIIRNFYRQAGMLLDLIGKYRTEELVEILMREELELESGK
jgi:DNA-binding transcriptional regulator GbsR (MarR family)